jgi:hypothetical protein
MFERLLKEHVICCFTLTRLNLKTVPILCRIAVTLLYNQLHVVYLLQQVDLMPLKEDTVHELFLLLRLLFRRSSGTTR